MKKRPSKKLKSTGSSVGASGKVRKKRSVSSREAKIRDRQAKLKRSNSGGFDYFIFKEGTKRMRAVPVPESEEFAVEVMRFYIGGEVKSFISPASFGEPCAVFEKYEELKESDDETEVEMASKMGLGRRYLMPFYAYKDENGKEVDTDTGVKLAMLTNSQYQQLLNFYMEAEKGDFTDPIEGYDVKFTREGKGRMDTTYTVLDCKPSKGYKPYVNKEYDPEEMVRELLPTYEQTEQYLEQFLESYGMSDDEDDEDLKPRKKKVKKGIKPSRKSKRRGDL